VGLRAVGPDVLTMYDRNDITGAAVQRERRRRNEGRKPRRHPRPHRTDVAGLPAPVASDDVANASRPDRPQRSSCEYRGRRRRCGSPRPGARTSTLTRFDVVDLDDRPHIARHRAAPTSAIHKRYGFHEVLPRTTVDAAIVAPVTPGGRLLASSRPAVDFRFLRRSSVVPTARNAARARPEEHSWVRRSFVGRKEKSRGGRRIAGLPSDRKRWRHEGPAPCVVSGSPHEQHSALRVPQCWVERDV
jgi:hypothetical protein